MYKGPMEADESSNFYLSLEIEYHFVNIFTLGETSSMMPLYLHVPEYRYTLSHRYFNLSLDTIDPPLFLPESKHTLSHCYFYLSPNTH